MAIDDKLEKLVESLSVEADPSLQLVAMNALIASIPFVGAAIASAFSDVWKERLIKRMVTLFDEIKHRIETGLVPISETNS
jgi:hypothetical protein